MTSTNSVRTVRLVDSVPPLDLKQAKKIVRGLGGRLIYNEYDEYMVRFGAATYFASSLDDAIGTARLMAEPNRKTIA